MLISTLRAREMGSYTRFASLKKLARSRNSLLMKTGRLVSRLARTGPRLRSRTSPRTKTRLQRLSQKRRFLSFLTIKMMRSPRATSAPSISGEFVPSITQLTNLSVCVCFFVGTNVTEHDDLSSNSDSIKIVVKNFVQFQISRGFLAQNYDNCHNSDKKSRFFLLKKKSS